MKILTRHNVDQNLLSEAINKNIDDVLATTMPTGVEVISAKKPWKKVLNFDFYIKKEPLNFHLKGIVVVTDTKVRVECDVPAVVRVFVDEEKIQKVLLEQLNSVIATL
ncbi:MAG: hypothetical protein ABH884_00420 [Candidatus Komeilibacteria bacterium]